MSVFKFLKDLSNDIDKMVCNYWRGTKKEDKTLCLTIWDGLCFTKNKGGLGFRKMNILNDALIAKQIWRIIINNNTIIHNCLTAKYFPNMTIKYAKGKPTDRYLWKILLHTKDMLLKRCS